MNGEGSTEIFIYSVSSAQSLSCVGLFVIPWTAACQASLSITNSQGLPWKDVWTELGGWVASKINVISVQSLIRV